MAEASDGSSAESVPGPANGPRHRWISAHPLVVVALGAAVVAVIQGWWIWTHRRLGAYDPDEAGYIATALQYQRSIDFLHPYQFVHAVGGTGTGPLVPLLSLVTLVPGPRDPRTVMLVLPLLALLGSVFVAGTTMRLAGPRSAIVAGLSWSVLPTVLLATQTYWLGLGTATALAGAMWALVTSDRCENRRIWLFGFFVGCMLLARTMAIGFVPGLVLAGLIVAGADRRRLRRLVGAFGVTLLVAGPWWAVEWTTITDYLLGYGYGTRAGLFGQGGVPERLGLRLSRVLHGVGQPVVVSCLVLAVVAGAWAWRRRHVPPAWREGLALAVMFVGGIAALTSTSNNGVWFELPLIAVVVPLGAAVVASLPRPLAAIPVVPLVGMALIQLPIVWWWADPTTPGIRWIAPTEIHGAQWEDGFAQYDPRFATARRSEGRRAAAEWWALNSRVERTLHRITEADPLTVFTLSGNMEMLNSNTLTLAGELRGWGARIWIPDTTVPDAERRRDLAPRVLDTSGRLVRRCCDGRTTPRVLVVSLHDYILFTPDADVRSFYRQARASGWRPVERFDMPGDRRGEVVILEHPRNTRRR